MLIRAMIKKPFTDIVNNTEFFIKNPAVKSRRIQEQTGIRWFSKARIYVRKFVRILFFGRIFTRIFSSNKSG